MSTLIEEKQYLKELKFTHQNQIERGKLYNAENTKALIESCEKRIELMSKKTVSVLVDGIIWKPLKDWEATHLISNTGVIKKKGYNSTNINGITRYVNGSEVALSEQKGYLKVILTDRNRTRRLTVSNLVYEHFIGEIPAFYMAKPINGDMFNCCDYNLKLEKIDNTVNKYRKTKINLQSKK